MTANIVQERVWFKWVDRLTTPSINRAQRVADKIAAAGNAARVIRRIGTIRTVDIPVRRAEDSF